MQVNLDPTAIAQWLFLAIVGILGYFVKRDHNKAMHDISKGQEILFTHGKKLDFIEYDIKAIKEKTDKMQGFDGLDKDIKAAFKRIDEIRVELKMVEKENKDLNHILRLMAQQKDKANA